MRLKSACAAAVVVLLAPVSAAFAQGKDPFRPPPGAGATVAPANRAPGEAPAPEAPAVQPGGLARTGQDVGTQLAIALLLVALGGALRLAERGISLFPGSG